MSLAAAQMALDDAKYDPAAHDPYATSVVLASGSGGNEFGQREIQALWSQGRQAVTAYQSIAWFYAASAGQTSILHGTKGPAAVLVRRRRRRAGQPGRRPPGDPAGHAGGARRRHRGAAVAVRAGLPDRRPAG